MSNNLMALAIIPGLLIIIYVYKKDKVEKEPVSLIIKLIILGAVSCVFAAIIEGLEASFLPEYPKGTLGYALINAFAMAALVEETVKYLALRIGSWKYKGFNYRFDGIVYGVSAAIGFALFENVSYVASYGLSTAIVRAFTAVPLHAFCGVFMGIFYSYEKKASILGQGSTSLSCRLAALIIPMIIHGVYDTLAFLQTENSTFALLVFVVILYIISITTIKKLSKADRFAGFYPKARTIEYDIDL